MQINESKKCIAVCLDHSSLSESLAQSAVGCTADFYELLRRDSVWSFSRRWILLLSRPKNGGVAGIFARDHNGAATVGGSGTGVRFPTAGSPELRRAVNFNVPSPILEVITGVFEWVFIVLVLWPAHAHVIVLHLCLSTAICQFKFIGVHISYITYEWCIIKQTLAIFLWRAPFSMGNNPEPRNFLCELKLLTPDTSNMQQDLKRAHLLNFIFKNQPKLVLCTRKNIKNSSSTLGTW